MCGVALAGPLLDLPARRPQRPGQRPRRQLPRSDREGYCAPGNIFIYQKSSPPYVYQEKYNSRIQRLVKAARLRFPQANVQDVYYKGRGLNQELLAGLFSCQYIAGHQSIILQGFTGSGKTYLACAPGKQACLHQIRTRYIRLPDLLMEYSDAALVPGKQKQLLDRYGKFPLLIIDEWLVSDISDSELYFLFELMERRSDSTSTIFCTQYRKEDWIRRLGEGVQAEAVVDRYAYTAFWIETGSMNMREYFAKNMK